MAEHSFEIKIIVTTDDIVNLHMDDFDADVADQILQNAVFGEVVYS